MTEEEWLASGDPAAMLREFNFTKDSIQGRLDPPSDRKLRLFGVACCRQMWLFFAGPVSQFWKDSADWAESFADGETDGSTLPLLRGTGAGEDVHDLSLALATTSIESLTRNSGLPSFFSVTTKHSGSQAALLREIVGNPWRPVTMHDLYSTGDKDAPDSIKDSNGEVVLGLCRRCGKGERDLAESCSYITPTVLSIAEEVYEGQKWEELPVLADALEDADCWNEDIIAHLRSSGPHYRGMWSLDLVLGKE